VAVDVTPVARHRAVRSGILSVVAALDAGSALAALVAVSFAVRWVFAGLHATPTLLPDEFLYAELARGIAEHGRPAIHGVAVTFPALLQPLLTAPFWLADEPATAFRLTQGLHALVMSLAAVPVFALCRRLGLSFWFSFGAAALAVASPDLLYASWNLAEPLAYPLVLGAVYAGVRALAAPTRRAQLAFVALAGLAAFARIQFAVLPLAFAVAALAVERWRPLAAFRRFRLTFLVFALPVAGVLALGPRRILGPYVGLFLGRVDFGVVADWTATNAMLLTYAAGWILVPGALVGLAVGLARPRSREETAFAGLTAALAGLLLVEAGLVSELEVGRFHERYLFVLLPLVAPAFGLGLRRGRRAAIAAAGLALGLLLVAVRLPIGEHLVADKPDASPTLLALIPIGRHIGAADTAFVVLIVVTCLSLAGAILAFRPRWAARVGLAATLALAVSLSVGATAWEAGSTPAARDEMLPADESWVDHAHLGPVALLQLPLGDKNTAVSQLFWNRSVDKVLLLDGATPFDAFSSTSVRVARDGRLIVRNDVVRSPLLVQTTGSALELSGARRVARTSAFELWRPLGTPRVVLFAKGKDRDGWLRPKGRIRVWPLAAGARHGTLRLELALPSTARATSLRLRAAGTDRTVHLRPGTRVELAFAVDGPGPWTLAWQADRFTVLGGLRVVAARAPVLRFEPDGV
jgi:hypothetical protein